MHDHHNFNVEIDESRVVNDVRSRFAQLELLSSLAILFVIWILVIVTVNPVGEFMINDDWSFVRIVETLFSEGRLIATGWGKGGPSAIVHVLWGGLFTSLFGFSITVLRISVLTMGFAGSIALLLLLRRAGASTFWSILGSLTLVLNPLFLAESFTFMTDVTFTSLVAFSLLFLDLGQYRSSLMVTLIGLLFALGSILTRQIGIVIPMAFVTVCLFPRVGRNVGKVQAILLALGVTIVPWIAYEAFLSWVGSTPVTEHEVIHRLLSRPFYLGLWNYAELTMIQFLAVGLGYSAFLVSPLLVILGCNLLKYRFIRITFGIITTVFVVLELALLSGLIDLPVLLHRNVIFNFGIGPILLKDTYIFRIPRTSSLSSELYQILVWWAAVNAVTLFTMLRAMVMKLVRFKANLNQGEVHYVQALALTCTIFYLGIITLTGFHDRYLIPVCLFLIIWLVPIGSGLEQRKRLMLHKLIGVSILVVIGALSVAMVHDFMSMKRSLKKAQDYVVNDLGVRPCHFDGGFEFNGYHCYQKDFEPKKGLSWWWVKQEDYLVTLGPLSGYQVSKVFPFRRWVGSNGGVHILQPLLNGTTPARK